MSYQSTVQQTEAGDPMPESLIELQQLAIAMLLTWDVLGDDYRTQFLVEQAALSDWATKHKISRADANELLVLAKERLTDNPFIHYVGCRDFKNEGWVSVFLMKPNGNKDVMGHIEATLKHRPFPEKKEKA
jgi:hypothetical protein